MIKELFKMKKRLILAFLLFAGLCWAQYDSTPVPVVSAGYGLANVNGKVVTGYGFTYADPGHPFTCGGLLSRVYIRLYDSGTDTGIFKIKVLRGSSSPYTLVGEINALTHILAWQAATTNATRANYDTSATYGGVTLNVEAAGIEVKAGDFLGFTTGSNPSVAFVFLEEVGNNLIRGTGDTTALSNTTYANMALLMNGTVKTKEYVIYDEAGTFGDGSQFEIPAFINQNYYVIVDHKTPDEDDLQIVGKYMKSTDATIATAWTLNHSYDGAGDDDDKLALFAGSDFSDTYSQSVTGQESDVITTYIRHNVSNGKLDSIFVNYENGQGLSDSDIKHVLLNTSGSVDLSLNIAGNPIRRLTIASGGSAGDAQATRIVVCRKPILALGDSFCSAYSGGKTSLAHVANRMKTDFSENRYVINGGITGNKVLTDYTTHTALFNRWNNSGLSAYKDIVAVFVNGPGLNDVAQGVSSVTTDEDCYTLAGLLASTVLRMASQARQAGNDVILCGQMAYAAHAGVELIKEQKTQKRFNDLIKAGVYTLSVPYVDSWNVDSDGTHPTVDGDKDYAKRIGRAYENNKIVNPYIGGGHGGFGGAGAGLLGGGSLLGN